MKEFKWFMKCYWVFLLPMLLCVVAGFYLWYLAENTEYFEGGSELFVYAEACFRATIPLVFLMFTRLTKYMRGE